MPFQPLHFSSGPVVVEFGASSNTLAKLGFSEDGIRMTIQPFYDNVHSDDFGGRPGPPSDAQLLGAIATVDVEFSKYVKADMDKLSAFRVSSSPALVPGQLPPIGTFVRQDGLAGVLKLTGVKDSFTYATSFLRRNQEINTGTKYRRYVVGWECWMDKPNYESLAQAQYRQLFIIT